MSETSNNSNNNKYNYTTEHREGKRSIRDCHQNECICNRSHRYVLCRVCGYYIKGRVQYFCSIHPKTIFLCDIKQCPRCKACGFMLREF